MLAIIPARGGSKGVPKKNIRLLGGKPLIQWTIEAAMHATSINRVILSTDDDEIAEVCKPLEIEIPFMRPKELAQDDSLAIDNYIYTVERLNTEFNDNIEEFVVLLPTVPLRIAEDIDNAVALFHKKNADSIIPCNEFHHPLEWIFGINDDGTISQRDTDVDIKIMMNRQETKSCYIPNGAVFVFRSSLLKKTHSYYSEKTYAYVMPSERSIDIDTEFDFKFAEFLVGRRASCA